MTHKFTTPQGAGECGYCGAHCLNRNRTQLGVDACAVCLPQTDPDVGTGLCCPQPDGKCSICHCPIRWNNDRQRFDHIGPSATASKGHKARPERT